MYTTQSFSLAKDVNRTLTKQYLIKFVGLRGNHRAPCDAHTKWLECYNTAVLGMYATTKTSVQNTSSHYLYHKIVALSCFQFKIYINCAKKINWHKRIRNFERKVNFQHHMLDDLKFGHSTSMFPWRRQTNMSK